MWMPSGSTFFLSRFFKENNMTLAFGKSLLPATVGFDRLFSTMEEYEKLYTTRKSRHIPHIISLDTTKIIMKFKLQ